MRAWLRRHQDRNSFVTANIVLILEKAGVPDDVAAMVDAAKRHLATYREGHRAWHWPLREGRSAMANAPPLWRHRFVEISPDADCTCLVQLARRDAGLDDAILDDLAFYRADGDRFSLPRFQKSLPSAKGSFLTWFPPRERCHSGKIETIDAGADANILWYLASIGRLDTPGAADTLAFLTGVVRSGYVLRRPFRVSMYYPDAAVLLYLIARAAVWGNIAPLLALRPILLAQLEQCPAATALQGLCRAAAIRLLGGPVSDADLPRPDGLGALYVGPLLAWPLQRVAALEPLAASPATHIEFRSEALEWALDLSLGRGVLPAASPTR